MLLSTITARTLVVGCTYDQMVPVDNQRAQAAAIPGARYDEVAAGHMFPIETPELFTATVTNFLDESAA